MIFTSSTYLFFFIFVFSLYWIFQIRKLQNTILLVSSYVFYGWITPWFCLLIATSTIVDFLCGLGMKNNPYNRKYFLLISIFCNLGMLCIFKYANFFIDNFVAVFSAIGLSPNIPLLQIILPVGISFYTFQTLSYTIDVYRGELEVRDNFVDFALFVSFFPQLVAGPIERAKRFLPQIEKERRWSWENCEQGLSLIILGYFKKLVIADNVSFFVDKVYMLESPDLVLFAVGTFAFSIQIYADFSGYTDIARGSAKLLGFNLTTNFKMPYFAVTPSDFWRRWHISLSSWIRDYIYLPLGGSRHKRKISYVATVLTTMFLCGLWHGAAWNYVVWGVFHGVLLILYRMLGMGGAWRPKNVVSWIFSWVAMYSFILIGWSIFRAPNMGWWYQAISNLSLSIEINILVTAIFLLLMIIAYSCPLILLFLITTANRWHKLTSSFIHACFLIVIVIFHSESGQDFIYFQF